jgi:hypothetical protein
MHITPIMVEQAYELLRATPPFNRWKLPEADDVEFRIVKSPNIYGQHALRYTKHKSDGHDVIDISLPNHRYLPTLICTMAHEMVHLKQRMLGYRDAHGKNFKRMAKSVCHNHGWDEGAF